MDLDVRNPAFPRSIPNGTVTIGSLLQVVFFGLFPGCRWAHSPVGEWGGSGDRSRRSLGTNWTPVGIDIGPRISYLNTNSNAKRELELDIGLELELEFDPDP